MAHSSSLNTYLEDHFCLASQYGTIYTSQRIFITSCSICVVVGASALGLGVVLGSIVAIPLDIVMEILSKN